MFDYFVTYHGNNGAGQPMSRHLGFSERPFHSAAEMLAWARSEGIRGSVKLSRRAQLLLRVVVQ